MFVSIHKYINIREERGREEGNITEGREGGKERFSCRLVSLLGTLAKVFFDIYVYL